MIDKLIERELIVKLKKRLEAEGIDTSLLRKTKEFEDEIDYSLGDLGLAIFIDSELPQFHVFWNTFIGQKYLPYEKWSFSSLEEHMNCFIDDFIMYYRFPDKRLNPVFRGFKWIFNRMEL